MEHPPNRASYSGPLAPGPGWSKPGNKHDDISIGSARPNLSTLSGLVASRTSLSEKCQDIVGPAHSDAINQVGRFSDSQEELGPTRKQDRKHHTQIMAGSRHTASGRASTKEPFPVSYIEKLTLRLLVAY